jgi:hypothetical protein
VQAPPEIQAMFGTPGKPVPRVNTEDLKALWTDQREHPAGMTESRVIAHLCTPGADVNAAWFRSARLQMLMMRCGKKEVQPPAILFTFFAKVPMKWWQIGVPRRRWF